MASEVKALGSSHLSDEERRRGLAVLAEIDALQERMLAARGGVPFTSSAEMVRQARQERSEHLDNL